jgi:transcription elongation GreA/GreB family factor
MDYSKIRKNLLNKCHDYVDARIASIQKTMDQAQESANNETKSSAGDKYETGRSMMQLEREQNAKHLEEAYKLKKVLDQVINSSNDKAGLGSLVITDKGNYFLAISIGKVEMDGVAYFIISPVSPIGKLLSGKEVKDSVEFNNEKLKIEQVINC